MSTMTYSLLEIGMKTSLAGELAGGIACPTFVCPGQSLVGQEVLLAFGFLQYLRGLGKLLGVCGAGDSACQLASELFFQPQTEPFLP